MRVAAVMTGGAFGHVELEESGACRFTRIAPNCSRPVSPRSATRPLDKQRPSRSEGGVPRWPTQENECDR